MQLIDQGYLYMPSPIFFDIFEFISLTSS